MKAVMIAFDQAHYDLIIERLTKLDCRGFTSFGTVQGRGSVKGEPHYGTHAWPSLAGAILTIVEDEKVAAVLAAMKAIDDDKPKLGLRAWTWNIEQSI